MTVNRELRLSYFIDRFQNYRGLPCIPRYPCPEVEVEECLEEGRPAPIDRRLRSMSSRVHRHS